MITEKEVPYVLGEELPEIKIELKKNNDNISKVFHCFYNYTKRCAEAGNINKLKSCFHIAERLLRKGNNAVRSAVENFYINAVSTLIDIVSPVQKLVQKILPESLKKACLKRIADLYSYNEWKDENCLFQAEPIELQNNYYNPFNV
jgi:hypothetical protein